MARLARAGRRDPAIRKFALGILRERAVHNRDYNGELAALHGWVRDNIRYIRDPVDTLSGTRKKGIEMLATPAAILRERAGDCDEHVIVLSSLLGSIGHPSRFVAIGMDGRPFSHVYLESPTQAGTWLTAETTEPVNLGWQPRGVTRRLVHYAN